MLRLTGLSATVAAAAAVSVAAIGYGLFALTAQPLGLAWAAALTAFVAAALALFGAWRLHRRPAPSASTGRLDQLIGLAQRRPAAAAAAALAAAIALSRHAALRSALAAALVARNRRSA